jgi:hypothetical protein
LFDIKSSVIVTKLDVVNEQEATLTYEQLIPIIGNDVIGLPSKFIYLRDGGIVNPTYVIDDPENDAVTTLFGRVYIVFI